MHASTATAFALPAAEQWRRMSQDRKPLRSIVKVAADAGNFTTLLSALEVVGLVDALQGAGPFTVFAPTDAAFAKLPAGTVESLFTDPETLASILTYHVVAGKALAGDIVRGRGTRPATLNGQPLAVTVRGGKVFVNSAQVTPADIAAENGVIHVIDAVLLPAAATPGIAVPPRG